MFHICSAISRSFLVLHVSFKVSQRYCSDFPESSVGGLSNIFFFSIDKANAGGSPPELLRATLVGREINKMYLAFIWLRLLDGFGKSVVFWTGIALSAE
jgi:hypothetical protein